MLSLLKKRNSTKIIPDQIDVEAGQSEIKPNYHFISSHENNLSNNYSAAATLIYIVFVIVTIFAMFVPIFSDLTEIHNVSNTTGSFGIFGDTLRTSTRLKIMESISIGCTLPMLSDKFLDQVTEKNTKMTLSMWHRILFLVAFSISSILYLNLSDYFFMPYLYIVLNNTKVLLVGAVTSYSVLNGSIMKSMRSKFIFFIPVVICGLRYVLAAYDLLFPGHSILSITTTTLFYLSFISFFGVQIPWYYLLWCRYRINKSLNNEEKKECVYMVAMFFYIVACEVVTIIFGFTESWLDTGENVLIGYIVVQIVCILLATVLPTWFMRKVVQVSEAILELKREFVRYVSHEIRSPLNVVHAGLELLRADLAAGGALSSTLSLLQDIFFASSAAIDILNDMLQYEHIDSGTFKLDCAAVSIVRAFTGRMDGFKFLLSAKNIALKIEDHAQVSEFYSDSDDRRELDIPAFLPFLSLRASNPSLYIPSSSLVLFMDIFRVEQIIRNLMTNAVKFTPEGGDITIRFLICSDDPQLRQQQQLDALSPETVTGFSPEALSVTKRFLRIEVQDSGVGIAIEDQPKMFKQFTQFNRNTLQGGGGSGLGLWICKNLAAFHGGRMGFRSEGSGKGSTFFADLPMYSAREMAPPSSPRPDTPVSTILPRLDMKDPSILNDMSNHSEGEKENDEEDGNTRSIVLPFRVEEETSQVKADSTATNANAAAARMPTRILIVDDSSMNRKIIRRMLESSINAAVMGEVIVEEADDGSTALQALQVAATPLQSYGNEVVDGIGENTGRGVGIEDTDDNLLIEQADLERGGVVQQKHFDLIFVDYVMTTMNGPDAVKVMRRDLNFSGGIIGVTGNALPSDLTYFEQCGADLVITKPLTNKKLMDAVQSVTQTKNRNMRA